MEEMCRLVIVQDLLLKLNGSREALKHQNKHNITLISSSH